MSLKYSNLQTAVFKLVEYHDTGGFPSTVKFLNDSTKCFLLHIMGSRRLLYMLVLIYTRSYILQLSLYLHLTMCVATIGDILCACQLNTVIVNKIKMLNLNFYLNSISKYNCTHFNLT